jgi:hypothetical protein
MKKKIYHDQFKLFLTHLIKKESFLVSVIRKLDLPRPEMMPTIIII